MGAPPSPPLVVVVVLNWNGAAMTIDCVRSLQSSRYPNLRVLVVDNASTDGSTREIANTFPDVDLIVNAENRGFAGGNNVGIRAAMSDGADFVLVLNNDTIVDPDAVGILVEEAQRRPDAGALSPIIFFADPPDLVWFAGADFDPRRGYPGRMIGYRERQDDRFTDVRATARLSGAAMLVPRRAIERTGVFDEQLYFLYEDVDWSLRMRATGLRLYVVPAAKVWHRVAAAQRGEHSPLSIYYGTRNQLIVSRRHAQLGRTRSLRRTAVWAAINLVRVRRTPRRLRGLRAFIEGFAHGITGQGGPWHPPA